MKLILKKSNLNKNLSFVILFILIFIFIFFIFYKLSLTKQSPSQYSETILELCASTKYRQVCYDKEILKLTAKPLNLSMQEGFEIARFIQVRDSSYLNCHVLGHELASMETKKDPSRWQDVITQCPTTMCNNGCPHGALMERYQAESLTDEQIEEAKPDLSTVCLPRGNWHPQKVEISMCHHGLGHLAMYMTNADVLKSIQVCRDISKKPTGEDYTQTCIEGVFMQIFQPLGAEDVALVKKIAPDKNTVEKFCRRFTGDSYDACKRESWTFFRDEILTPEGFTRHCTYTTEFSKQEKCMGSLLNNVTDEFIVRRNDTQKLSDFCRQLATKYQGICYGQTARRLLQIDPKFLDQALNICQLAQESSSQNGNACYNILTYYGYWLFNVSSSEYKSYCSSLPQNWQEKCLLQSN